MNKSRSEAHFIPIPLSFTKFEELNLPEQELNAREMLDLNTERNKPIIEFEE